MQSTGRCLCGSVQYTITGAPTIVLDCHCSMCRRESGAPSLVFVGYRRADVSIDGPLKYYHSSNIAKRGFCPNCGSPICYEVTTPMANSYGLPLARTAMLRPYRSGSMCTSTTSCRGSTLRRILCNGRMSAREPKYERTAKPL
jgi:hypothetical protein